METHAEINPINSKFIDLCGKYHVPVWIGAINDPNGPRFHRKGYAFEALSALLELLQNDLCLEMVTAGVLPENMASEKLLGKLGFQREGARHKAVWHEGLDKPVDLIYYYRDAGSGCKR